MRGAAEAPALTATLELIGDTAMYASDWPHWDNEDPRSLHRISERADLTDEMRAQVLAGAAQRFYGRALVP